MDTRIYLVRHGDTEWAISGQHTGRTDLSLTEHGEEQAQHLRGLLRKMAFARVLTSPLQRACRTCELTGFGAIAIVEPDLQEWSYGDYEGRTTAETRRQRPDWDVYRDGCPNGESAAQVSTRADRVVASLRESAGNTLIFFLPLAYRSRNCVKGGQSCPWRQGAEWRQKIPDRPKLTGMLFEPGGSPVIFQAVRCSNRQSIHSRFATILLRQAGCSWTWRRISLPNCSRIMPARRSVAFCSLERRHLNRDAKPRSGAPLPKVRRIFLETSSSVRTNWSQSSRRAASVAGSSSRLASASPSVIGSPSVSSPADPAIGSSSEWTRERPANWVAALSGSTREQPVVLRPERRCFRV